MNPVSIFALPAVVVLQPALLALSQTSALGRCATISEEAKINLQLKNLKNVCCAENAPWLVQEMLTLEILLALFERQIKIFRKWIYMQFIYLTIHL